MKPARSLLMGGRVSEAKYEPPLLSSYVREGGKKYRSGLRIKSALDIENLCSLLGVSLGGENLYKFSASVSFPGVGF